MQDSVIIIPKAMFSLPSPANTEVYFEQGELEIKIMLFLVVKVNIWDKK